MPQLAALYKKYRQQGFHIVGIECQNSGSERIAQVVSDWGAEYQITVHSGLRGTHISSIPHGFLFGPDGNLVAEAPEFGELERDVRQLLAQAKQRQEPLPKPIELSHAPDARSEIDAAAFWQKIAEINGNLKPFDSSSDHKSEGFRKENAAAIKVIVTACQMLTERFPGTTAAQKAARLMGDLQ